MIRDDDFALRLAGWLEEGPFEAPARGVEAAIAHARAHPRDRARWELPWLRSRRRSEDGLPPVPVERVRPPLRLAWVVVLVLVLLALGATAFVASRRLAVVVPPTLPGNGLLAFSYEGDVWTVSPTGGNAHDVTASANETETAPAWSPDGRWLAVRVQGGSTSLFRIDVMRPDGSERRPISWTTSSTQGSLAWSPDSRFVAVGFGEAETAQVTLFDITGLEQPRTLGEVAGSSPIYSPDGERIAFVGLPPGEGRRDLFVADVDDGSTIRLTGPGILTPTLVSHPSWAEGGRTIVFDAGHAEAGVMVHAVYSIAVDGTDLRPVGPPGDWRSDREFGAAPVVAPDGHTVAFSGAGAVQEVTLEVDDRVTELGRQAGPDGIEWSPDGRSIAYLDWAACDPGPGGGSSMNVCLDSLAMVGPVRYGTTTIWTAPDRAPAAGPPPTFTWDLSWQPLPGDE